MFLPCLVFVKETIANHHKSCQLDRVLNKDASVAEHDETREKEDIEE